MKKSFLILIIFFILLSFSCFAKLFEKDKSVIYLSPSDFAQIGGYDVTIQNHNTYRVGQRIYFLVYSDKGFKSDYIKFQVVKQDDNAHLGGYTRIYNRTIRVKDKHSHSDYFVLNQAGKYFLQFFDIENLQHWFAITGFRVVDE